MSPKCSLHLLHLSLLEFVTEPNSFHNIPHFHSSNYTMPNWNIWLICPQNTQGQTPLRAAVGLKNPLAFTLSVLVFSSALFSAVPIAGHCILNETEKPCTIKKISAWPYLKLAREGLPREQYANPLVGAM